MGRIWNNLKNEECNYYINKAGYHNCSVLYLGNRVNIGVHRLVALHFIPNPDNKPTVNHKIADKSINHIGNLEWATHKEQSQHISDNVLHTLAVKCCEVSSEDKVINIFNSYNIAKRFYNFKSHYGIIASCEGKINSTNGIKLRLYDDINSSYIKTAYDNGKPIKGQYRKKIYCKDNNKVYNTQMEVAKDLGVFQSLVSRILSDKTKNTLNISYI